jgi:cytochrome c-type biogenesis protein CcsB
MAFSPRQARATIICAVLSLLCALSAQNVPAANPAAAPYDRDMERAVCRSDLARLAVQSAGIEESLASFSRTALNRIVGRTKLRGQDPVYSIAAMVFDAQRWREANLIPVDNPRLAHLLGLNGTEKQFISAQRVHQLTLAQDGGSEAKKLYDALQNDPAAVKAFERMVERALYLYRLPQELRILPNPNASPGAQWLSLAEIANATSGQSLSEAARTFTTQMTQAFRSRSGDFIAPATRTFLQYAKSLAGYPPDWKRQLSYLYTVINPFKWCYVFYLLACLSFLFFVLSNRRALLRIALGLIVCGFLLHTLGVAARYALAGRAPLANMYESIVFATWGLIGIALILELTRRSGYIGLFASGFAFIVMVAVSFLPLHMTRIEPLRAVLNSAWLTYHVTTVMLSYSAFMLSFLFSVAYLAKEYGHDRKGMQGERLTAWLPGKETLDLLNYRAVQIGWPLLTFGIFSGAVWANTAWGRFWGWDPKETWSLITWIIYTIFLHLRINQGWRGRKTAYAAVIGFLGVLVTWFGVSYLPIFHGLHTYA